MAQKDKSQRAGSEPQTPIEQTIAGRLYGSDTEMEREFDSRHDISHIDCQEGHMDHGTKGGCFDEAKEERLFPL